MEKFSRKLILDVQKLVEKGASKEKIGLRGPVPPGVLFAVLILRQEIRIIFHRNIATFLDFWMS